MTIQEKYNLLSEGTVVVIPSVPSLWRCNKCKKVNESASGAFILSKNKFDLEPIGITHKCSFCFNIYEIAKGNEADAEMFKKNGINNIVITKSIDKRYWQNITQL